jgi:glucose-6-phosphate 1-dehydrogenase
MPSRIKLPLRKAVLQQSETSTYCSEAKTMVDGWKWQEVGYVCQLWGVSLQSEVLNTTDSGVLQ